MREVTNNGLVVLVLLLAGGVGGCGDMEEACASGCPVTGQAATDDDIRFLIDTDNASAVLEDEYGTYDFAIMKGELVIRPKTRGCVASPDHVCPATIQRLSVTISDFTAGDFYFKEPTLSIDAPLEVVDIGNGIPVVEGTGVHSCVGLRGARQHAVREADVAANIILDDRGSSPLMGSLHAWWPLEIAFPVNECMTKTYRVIINASLME